jgi:hypothetical protein
MNAVYPFQTSPRCSATSKRTKERRELLLFLQHIFSEALRHHSTSREQQARRHDQRGALHQRWEWHPGKLPAAVLSQTS